MISPKLYDNLMYIFRFNSAHADSVSDLYVLCERCNRGAHDYFIFSVYVLQNTQLTT